MKTRIAAIDFGTNTARLLIADKKQSGFEQIALQRDVVRMGGGFSRQQGLSPEAWQRGLDCLKRFSVLIADAGGVESVRAVATSAVRDAVNGSRFIDHVFRETGIELNAIDGICEGELTLAGVLAGLDCPGEELFVFDVGGGSTEYTLARKGVAEFVRSLPLGVVRLTEGQGSLEAMKDKITRELSQLESELCRQGCRPGESAILVGTAGTATTLAAISMEMSDYDYRRVNNAVISRTEIEQILERLLPLSPSQRLAVPGLEKGREDLIIAGIAITLATMDLAGQEQLKVSDYGLLEGLVVSGLF